MISPELPTTQSNKQHDAMNLPANNDMTPQSLCVWSYHSKMNEGHLD